MNVTEAIKARKSVRNYLPDNLTRSETESIENAIRTAVCPFGGKVDIRLRRFETKGKLKPGTYGFISGASQYLLMAAGDDAESALAGGFILEQAVLKATGLGLGTCWIGGTFKGSQFSSGEKWSDGTSLKIVMPIGEPVGKEKFTGIIAKLIAGSANRKPFGSLFFENSTETSLPQSSFAAKALEMTRLAPSSVNSQPWRAIVTGKQVHFYSTSASYMSMIDCGIGLCHFYLTMTDEGRHGTFAGTDNHPETPAGWKYITTFLAE